MKTPKPPVPKITVLPYMGKPKETAAEAKRKAWKPQRVVTDGTRRIPARIRELEE